MFLLGFIGLGFAEVIGVDPNIEDAIHISVVIPSNLRKTTESKSDANNNPNDS